MANTMNLATKGKGPKRLVLVDSHQAQEEKARAEFDWEAYVALRQEAIESLLTIQNNVLGFVSDSSAKKNISYAYTSDLKLATENFIKEASDELMKLDSQPSLEAAMLMRDNVVAIEATFSEIGKGDSQKLTNSFKRVQQLAKKTENTDPDLQEFANAMKYVVAACYVLGAVVTLTALAFAPVTGGFSAFLCIPGVLAMAAGAVIEKSVQPTGRKAGLPRAMSYFAEQTKVVNKKIIHADTLSHGMRREWFGIRR